MSTIFRTIKKREEEIIDISDVHEDFRSCGNQDARISVMVVETEQSITHKKNWWLVVGLALLGNLLLWIRLLANLNFLWRKDDGAVRRFRIREERESYDLNHAIDTKRAFDDFLLLRAGGEASGASRSKSLSRYIKVRERCEWQDYSDPNTRSRSGSFDYMWWPSDEALKSDYWGDMTSWMMTGGAEIDGWFVSIMNRLFRPPTHGPPVKSQFCVVKHLKDHQEWRIRRMGPFVGEGGFDWHRMKVVDSFMLRHNQDVLLVSAQLLAPVNENGEILGNPPIHIHHANLNPAHRITNFSRIDQWHGDSQCLHEDGGVACYLREMPEGYGFPMLPRVPLHLDADLNDVRPSGSPQLKFYVESAVKVHTPVVQADAKNKKADDHKVGVIILGTPARSEWWRTSDFAGTYHVPSSKYSALWCTGRLPVSGTFVSGHPYTHQSLFMEALVFSGVSPQDLGLNLNDGGKFDMKRPWEPWVPNEPDGLDGEEAMDDLHSSVLQKFNQLVESCKERQGDSNPCTMEPRLIFRFNETAIDPEDGEARQMHWPELPWTFQAGDQFTSVIFHRPMAKAGTSSSSMQQHFALHGNYVPLEGEAAEYHYVLPTLDPYWAWIDAPNKVLLLTHLGGPPTSFWNKGMLIIVVFGSVCVFGVAQLVVRRTRHKRISTQ